jgi:hypothetical protein
MSGHPKLDREAILRECLKINAYRIFAVNFLESCHLAARKGATGDTGEGGGMEVTGSGTSPMAGVGICVLHLRVLTARVTWLVPKQLGS